MKKLKLFTALLVSSVMSTIAMAAVDPGTVSMYATDPALPIIDEAVTIYVNVNNWDITDIDTVTAYLGTITTMSTDNTDDWKYVKNTDWSDISIVMTEENDSVFSLTIDDIATFFAVPDGEDVVRIPFIARGTKNAAVSGQTSNLYFEVYPSSPTTLVATQPTMLREDGKAVYTFNVNQSENTTVMDTIAGGVPADSLYVYTWLTTTSENTYELAGWSDVTLKPVVVNDSIYRLYIMDNIRSYYSVEDTCDRVYQTNFILKTNHLDGIQTSNIEIMTDTMDITCEEDETGIVSNLSELEGVSVYPNPVNDVLNIRFDEAQTATITIVNAVGQVVYAQSIVDETYVTIDVAAFARNQEILFYTIKTEDKILTQKLLVY